MKKGSLRVKSEYKTQKSINQQRQLYLRYYVSHGFSANRIVQKMKEHGIGVRRKVLLSEIRARKGKNIKPNTVIYTPTKYKRKDKMMVAYEYKPQQVLAEEKKKGFMFRTSIAINNVPLHSNWRKPNYLSFLIQAFSESEELLKDKESGLKRILRIKASKYLGYNQDIIDEWDCGYDLSPIGVENCIKIPYDKSICEQYCFRVEKDGANQYEEYGAISEI